MQKSGVADSVHFTGFGEDADLVHFYGACDLFVFPRPSTRDSACRFWKPWLPGAQWRAPILPAMPEVADGAAILFDPSSRIEEMSRAIRDILIDSELRDPAGAPGNAAGFGVQLAARSGARLEVYARVAGAQRKAPSAVRVRAS